MKKIIFCLLAAGLISAQCTKSEGVSDCQRTVVTPADAVTGPTSTNLGQETEIKVRFTVSNGCGNFGEFEETAEGQTHQISILADYAGCNCTTALKEIEAVYLFKPVTAGEHQLIFKNKEGQNIVHTIQVIPVAEAF
ncbi:hypothetical protein GCM10027051_18300 [Niabella terrae]